MSLLALRDVTKKVDDRVLFHEISLSVTPTTRLALVGPNGCGKSTLLRILAGTEAPDSGERSARRDLRIGTLTQTPVFPAAASLRASIHRSLTDRHALIEELARVRTELSHAPSVQPAGQSAGQIDRLLARQGSLEARLSELGGEDIDHELDAELARLGLADADRPLESFSEGELRRAALARLFLAQPDLLLLDEPTNQLDVFVIDALEDRLLVEKHPFVLVTHDRYFLDRVVTEIGELDRGALFVCTGNYADYLDARAARFVTEAQNESSRDALLARETAWMRRGAPARTTKSKARIAAFEELSANAPTARGRELELEFEPGPRLGSRVIALRGVSKSVGGRPLFRALDFELLPGERVGIVGANGSGKSALLRLAAGEIQPDAGEREQGETVHLAWLDAQRQALDARNTVTEELSRGAEHVVVGERSVRVEAFLERFLFPGRQKHALVGQLSGGERMRLLLARLLLSGGNVLLLDEPTNDLDLSTLRALEGALLEFPGSALIVSHDRWFLDRVATRIVYLDGQGGLRQHLGDLSSLLENLALERARNLEAPRAKASARAPEESAPKRSKGLAPWEQREYDALLASIASCEAELASIDEELADPALYAARRGELPALQTRRRERQSALDTQYARWQVLEEKLSGA